MTQKRFFFDHLRSREKTPGQEKLIFENLLTFFQNVSRFLGRACCIIATKNIEVKFKKKLMQQFVLAGATDEGNRG